MSSIASIIQGLDYQYRHIWIEAARLLFPDSVVERVCLEHEGVKAWDDVVTFYKKPVLDYRGRGMLAEHFQLKYHVDGRATIRAEDLANPKFTGAEHYSLLNRLAEATVPGTPLRRFSLVTSWQIDQADPLFLLVSNGEGQILQERLFTGSAVSPMGKVRDVWRGHLGLSSNDDLRPIIGSLAIMSGIPERHLEERLEARLTKAGLVAVDPASARHAYADLAKAFIDQGNTEFDANTLLDVCKREKLCVEPRTSLADAGRELAITCFPRYAAHPEDEADALDLVPLFEGRALAPGIGWDADVVPQIDAFLQERVRTGGRYELNLDCHVSAAYAAGYLLSRSGADIAPVQVGRTRTVWRPDGANALAAWELREVRLGDGGDVAVAIEIAQPVADDVETYCKANLPEVGRVLTLSLPGGPSRTGVRDGDHAKALALAALREIRDARTSHERAGRLHLFAAVPNALAFFMGQEGRVLGRTTVYEYDFDSMLPGAYSPGASLPPGG